MFGVGDLRVDVAARRAWTAAGEVELRAREFDLLARLVRSAGEVVTREQLIADVWDEHWYGSTKTLDVHGGQPAPPPGRTAGNDEPDHRPARGRLPPGNPVRRA